MSTSSTANRFGPYQILSRLGKGGMAEVFRAQVLSGPREGWEVALKRILPELAADQAYIDLFTSEADLSRRLAHPNVVKVFEVGTLENVLFMVMEWVDGRDLGQILRRCRARSIPLPVDFAVHLAKVLLDALDYAHHAQGSEGEPLNIVHCDVSPSNMFISRVGEIKLGDFGIARAKLGGSSSSLLGKPYYQSPEILAGEVAPAADVWAAAVVLYELLTLVRPFDGDTPEKVFAAIRGTQVRPVRELRPEISPQLEAILSRAFSKDPQQRFGSAGELAAALVPLYDPHVGTDLGIAAVVRGLFGAKAE